MFAAGPRKPALGYTRSSVQIPNRPRLPVFVRPYLKMKSGGTQTTDQSTPAQRPQQLRTSAQSSRLGFLRESSTVLPQLRFQLLTQYDRDIWALFLPALVALLLEPLQQLADTVIIGRL